MGLKSTADADFVVTVTDIQDTPPAFFNLPYSVSVKENISLVSYSLFLLYKCLIIF